MSKSRFACVLAAALLGTLASLSSGAKALEPGADDRSWIDPKLLAAAKSEGAVSVFSAINEEEALPLWRIFEEATGLKVDYVRGNDAQLNSRIIVETRAGKQSWDIVQNTGVSKLPQSLLAEINLPEGRSTMPEARDPAHRWYGVTANYGTPAYNTKLVKPAELPKSYEEFLDHPEWAGRIAIDDSDVEWIAAILKHYGEDRGRKLATDIATKLKLVIVQGHLGLARSVGAGEYALALNNTLNLTVNVKMGGAPTDFWVLDPVVVYYNQVGVNAKAPHPNAARLAANFLLSHPAQQQLASRGRIPVRKDVETNPPGVLKALEGKTIIPIEFNDADAAKWKRTFTELMAGRR